MQLPLLEPEPFVPLPLGSAHYVAALQNKPGELAALAQTSEVTWRGFTPLLQLVGRREQPDVHRADTVSNWIKAVAAAVGGHPVFLDLLRLNPTHPVQRAKGRVALLDHIFWAARRRGLQFVPVLWVGESDDAHIRLVRDAHNVDCRGLALRYKVRALALAPSKLTDYLARLLSKASVDVTSADLLLDLDFLDGDVEMHPEDLGPVVAAALAVGDWRSVVLLGTSMPSMMSCVAEGTVGSLARKEWEIWSALSGAGLSRMPSFGDYGIQHSRPPDGGGPNMRASIRYTVDEVTLVARGRGSVLQAGKEQYVGLCQELLARDEFCGGDYSWGDGVIEDCAKGRIEPGAQNVWRGAGTSHHVRFVADQLSRRGRAA